MTTDGTAPEGDPFIKVDMREEQAISRAFRYTNDFSSIIYITPYFRMPPDPLKNKYDSIRAKQLHEWLSQTSTSQ